MSKSYSFAPNPKAKTDVDNQERHTQIYHLPADAILNQFKITGITTSPGWGLGDLNIKIDVVSCDLLTFLALDSTDIFYELDSCNIFISLENIVKNNSLV